MPNKKTKRRRQAKAAHAQPSRRGQRGATFVDVPYMETLLNSSRTSMPQNVIVNRVDYQFKVPSFSITQSPPRNLRNQIYWFQKTVTFLSSKSISYTSDTEYNTSFTVSNLIPNEVTALLSLFDQYCIHTIVIHVNVVNSLLNFSGTAGRLTTAIDYDNVGNLGSEAAVQEFSTAQTVEVTQGTSVERVLKPCVDLAVYQLSGTGYGPTRVWLDSVSNAVPHYGFRSYWTGNTYNSGGGLIADYVVTSVLGFRQSI